VSRYELVLQDSKGDILCFDVPEGSSVLGRGSRADIRIADPGVSRQHAMITLDGDGLFIRDLGSKNGTYVNGEPVIKKRLEPDDVITLGTQNMRLRQKPDKVPESLSAPRAAVPPGPVFMSSPAELIEQMESSVLPSMEELLASKGRLKGEALMQYISALRSLYKVFNILASERDIALKLQAVLDEALQQVQGECGYILLIDEKTRRLVPLYSSSTVPSQATISKSLAEVVLKEHASVLTDDAMADRRFSSSESVAEYKVHSVMAVPIWTEDEVLGVLYLAHHHKVAWFTKRHLEYASAVGKQIGIAVKKDSQLRKHKALARYLGNVKKVLEMKVRERTVHLQESLAKQKLVMDKLLYAEQLETIGRLAAGLAHQINNPLSVLKPRLRFIAKYADNLEQICKECEEHLSEVEGAGEAIINAAGGVIEQIKKIREALSVCSAELEDIQGTVDHLSLFSAIHSAKVGTIDVNRQIESILAVLQTELKMHRIEVVRQVCEPSPQLNCHILGFNQAVMNVILNSIEALRQKPVSPDFSRTLRIQTETKDESLIVTVYDNGVGIPEANIPRVFDPFFTTKSQSRGVGLGLTIARSVVVRHNGKIEIESQEGEGTTVRLTFAMNLGLDQIDSENLLNEVEAV